MSNYIPTIHNSTTTTNLLSLEISEKKGYKRTHQSTKCEQQTSRPFYSYRKMPVIKSNCQTNLRQSHQNNNNDHNPKIRQDFSTDIIPLNSSDHFRCHESDNHSTFPYKQVITLKNLVIRNFTNVLELLK